MRAKKHGLKSFRPNESKQLIRPTFSNKKSFGPVFFSKPSGCIFLLLTMLLMINFMACEKDEGTPDGPDDSIKDIDGNVYTSVKIGTQEWMVENLKVTKYRNGDAIPLIAANDDSWATLTTGAYSNDQDGTNKSGRLYNWYAVNDSRKLAPEGWHIPTEAEWTTLIDFLGGESVAGSKMKETGTAHWCAPNADATNESGFTALPGDWRVEIGLVTGCGDATWWSADEDEGDETRAHNLFVFEGTGEISRVTNDKFAGWGVRCIKD